MIRILIADDHAIVRRGMMQLLLQEYPTALIEEAADAESLFVKAMSNNWDLVVCDMQMPGRSGLEAMEQIKHEKPDLPVLIMSMAPEEQYALRVLKAGASGYLGKETIHLELIKAVQTVLQGRKFITPSIAEKLADAFKSDGKSQTHEVLSNREFDVFKLLASGISLSGIAGKLSLSVTTISTYRARIMNKMNMHSNADLIRYALEKELI